MPMRSSRKVVKQRENVGGGQGSNRLAGNYTRCSEPKVDASRKRGGEHWETGKDYLRVARRMRFATMSVPNAAAPPTRAMPM